MKNFFENDIIKIFRILKNKIENGSKKKKFFVNFFLVIFLFYLICWFFFFILRLYVCTSEAFFKIFPQFSMTESMFYEKYGCTQNDLSFFQRLKYCWLEFITWDPHTVVFKIVFLFLIFYFIYFLFFLIKQKINEIKRKNFIVIRNTSIQENLIFYHFISNYFIGKLASGIKPSIEEFGEIHEQVVQNIIDLYYIINKESSKKLLDYVVYFKNELILELKQNPNKMQQYTFDSLEKQHLMNLIEFLEKKNNNKEKMPLEFEDFVKKFSEFRIK